MASVVGGTPSAQSQKNEVLLFSLSYASFKLTLFPRLFLSTGLSCFDFLNVGISGRWVNKEASTISLSGPKINVTNFRNVAA